MRGAGSVRRYLASRESFPAGIGIWPTGAETPFDTSVGSLGTGQRGAATLVSERCASGGVIIGARAAAIRPPFSKPMPVRNAPRALVAPGWGNDEGAPARRTASA
jgi:hypothetical protein